MKESKLLKGVVATIAVVAFSAPAFASAGADIKGQMEKVRYADLNVDNKRGAEILYQRLQKASRRVCGVESIRTVRGAKIEADQRSCYRQTLDQAVVEMNSVTLDAVHEG
jgi:UrcA family protein